MIEYQSVVVPLVQAVETIEVCCLIPLLTPAPVSGRPEYGSIIIAIVQ